MLTQSYFCRSALFHRQTCCKATPLKSVFQQHKIHFHCEGLAWDRRLWLCCLQTHLAFHGVLQCGTFLGCNWTTLGFIFLIYSYIYILIVSSHTAEQWSKAQSNCSIMQYIEHNTLAKISSKINSHNLIDVIEVYLLILLLAWHSSLIWLQLRKCIKSLMSIFQVEIEATSSYLHT